jgi:hypothetical protein
VCVVFLNVLVAIGPVAATGGGGSGDAYRADIAPAGAAAGTSSTLVVTIRQLSGSSDKRVRSAQVTAPDGITITGATAKKGNNGLSAISTASTATVDGIPPLSSGQTVTVTLQTRILCGVGGSKTWAVSARNSNTFGSGGSALSQDPASQLTASVTRCSLEFSEQPADAGRDKVITGDTADPDGTPIKVQLLDGDGDPASQADVTVSLAIVSGTGASGATLAGTTSDDTNGDGVARFAPTIDRSERSYRLEASAAGIIGSGPSSAFDIEDVAKVCSGGCAGSSDKGTTSATVSSSSSGGVLRMSLGLDALSCDDAPNQYYQSSSSPLTWDVTSADGRTEVTIRLAAADVNRPYNLYDVCFSADSYGFRNRYNVRIDPGEAGLLKGCPPRLGKQDADPCVVEKWRENGDVLIKFSVPKGDPRGRI